VPRSNDAGVAAGGERRAVLRNAASSYGARALLAVSTLLLTPYLFRTLGAGGFGTWSVMFTLATVFSLLELGFANGVTKLIAELRAKGDRRGLDVTMGASVTLMAALGVAALGLAAASAFLLDGLAAAGDEDEFKVGMLLLGAIMPLRFAGTAYGTALIGYGRYDRYNWGQVVLAGGFPIAAVAAVEAGTGITGIAAAYAAALLGEAVVDAALLRRTDRELSLRPRLADPATRRRLGRLGSFPLLSDAMVFVGARMDTVLIAALRNAAAAAPYAAALKLQSALQALALPFVNLLMPMVSELWARGEAAEVARRLALTTRVAMQVTMPVALGLALFSEDIVGLWLGEDAVATTATIVVLLVATQVVTLTALPAEKALIGVGRVGVIGALAVVEGVVNVVLTIVLVSAHGAVGAAVATLVAYGVLAPARLPLAARAIGMRLGDLVRRGLVPALTSSLPPAAAMVAMLLVLPAGGVRGVAGLVVGAGIAAAIGLAQVGPGELRRTLSGAGRRAGEPDPYPAEA